MLELRIVDALAQQDWLDRASQTVQKVVQSIFQAGGAEAQSIEDLLHGTWLGHPLHPVLTDVPIGAWTAALVLDTLDSVSDEDFAAGADAAIVLGLAGAVGSAVTGLTDWKELDTKPLRIGLLHGLLNISAMLLYGASLVLRGRGARATGRGAALLGYTISAVAAYLGGDLVYREQIGVNHANPVWTGLKYTPVLADSDLPEGELRPVEIGDRRIMLARQGGRIYALAERCTHLGGPLADGELEDGTVRCPWHGSRFALEDGRPIEGPASIPQPCFATRVRDGQIEVRAAG